MRQISSVLLLLILSTVFAYSQKTKPVDYSQKIKEATPKPLPQTPVSEKLTSDAQDDQLKGKVKSLIEENESLSGISKPYRRTIFLSADYNETGNYLRQVYFDNRGRPFEVTVYGYIDGTRASISNPIEYGDENRGIVIGGKPEKEIKNKPDPRYEYKYEYKYVNGKLAEMQMITNTGEKGMRYVYNNNGNQQEWLAYTDDDELNQKFLYTFDEKENEIERIYYNVRQAEHTINGKYRYTYDAFDKVGNWTKRTYLKLEIEKGKEVYKPIAIEYRTITYYK